MKTTKQATNIKSLYLLRNKKVIAKFLSQNRDLVKYLLEAPTKIYEIFGDNVKLELELHTDPEENWDELFIIVVTPASPKETIEMERQLFKEWFGKIIDKVSGRLNYTSEIQR
jgi:hypothetical protein